MLPGRHAGAVLLWTLPAASGPNRDRPDPTASPEHSELAGAVSLLVVPISSPAQRGIVPRRELALAIEAMTGKGARQDADRPQRDGAQAHRAHGGRQPGLWELQVGQKGTTVAGTMVGPGRQAAAAHRRGRGHGRRGRAGQAAGQADRAGHRGHRGRDGRGWPCRCAPLPGGRVGDGCQRFRSPPRAPSISLCRRSWPVLAFAKNILLALAEDPALPALPRAQARLLLGEWAVASATGRRGAVERPQERRLARGQGARAGRAQELFRGRNRAGLAARLAQLSAVALAAVALAIERGDPWTRETPPWPPWQASRRMAPSPARHRGHATWHISARGRGSGAGGRREARGPGARAGLDPGGQGAGGGWTGTAGGRTGQGSGIEARIRSRPSARASAPRPTAPPRAWPRSSAHARKRPRPSPLRPGPRNQPARPVLLARNLRQVLQGFDALYDPAFRPFRSRPCRAAGSPSTGPFWCARSIMSEGLLETLMRSPWELQATQAKIQTELLPPERLTDEGLASLAHDLGCGALLLYRIRPAGLAPWVTLELVLHDVAHQRTDRIETSLDRPLNRPDGAEPAHHRAGRVLVFLAIFAWAIALSLGAPSWFGCSGTRTPRTSCSRS
jgi:hypothetical protein